jgi:hypothetical protein
MAGASNHHRVPTWLPAANRSKGVTWKEFRVESSRETLNVKTETRLMITHS